MSTTVKYRALAESPVSTAAFPLRGGDTLDYATFRKGENQLKAWPRETDRSFPTSGFFYSNASISLFRGGDTVPYQHSSVPFKEAPRSSKKIGVNPEKDD